MNDTKQPAILDTPTIDAMLSEQGVLNMKTDFAPRRLVGIEIDIEDVDKVRSTEGEDAVLAIKDKILTDLDTRLTKILRL